MRAFVVRLASVDGFLTEARRHGEQGKACAVCVEGRGIRKKAEREGGTKTSDTA